MKANLPILISIPTRACTNKKMTIEIPKRRWIVRTFSEFILLSLVTKGPDPPTIKYIIELTAWIKIAFKIP